MYLKNFKSHLNFQNYRTIVYKTLKTNFHVAVLLQNLFAFIYAERNKLPEKFGKEHLCPNRSGYFTNWNMLLQTLLFAVCTLNDIKGTNEIEPNVKPTIRKFKDKLLACLGFPMSMFVGLTFWAIYAIDRELVFPRALDAFFPTWLNHVMHTNIMIFVIIEMATSYCRYPSRKSGFAVVTIFMVCYLVWLHVIHAKTGLWVYPILEVLNLPLRIVFFASSLGLALLLYIVGENLNAILWSKQIKKIKVNKKKKH